VSCIDEHSFHGFPLSSGWLRRTLAPAFTARCVLTNAAP
jgi:hypothetical protein